MFGFMFLLIDVRCTSWVLFYKFTCGASLSCSRVIYIRCALVHLLEKIRDSKSIIIVHVWNFDRISGMEAQLLRHFRNKLFLRPFVADNLCNCDMVCCNCLLVVLLVFAVYFSCNICTNRTLFYRSVQFIACGLITNFWKALTVNPWYLVNGIYYGTVSV